MGIKYFTVVLEKMGVQEGRKRVGAERNAAVLALGILLAKDIIRNQDSVENDIGKLLY